MHDITFAILAFAILLQFENQDEKNALECAAKSTGWRQWLWIAVRIELTYS